MKKGLTELVLILDRSGSMDGLESDTIGGYNALLAKQKQEDGDAIVTTVLFDSEYEVLHNRIHIKGIRPMTRNEYFVRGTTALLDAIGKSIQNVIHTMRNTVESEQPEKVLFVITTDGEENASKEYDYHTIKNMIQTQKEVYHWEFIFLGANIDAVAEAEKFGIEADKAVNYHADSKGTELNYEVMSEAISTFRKTSAMPKNWKAEIDRDFQERNCKRK